MPIPRTLSWTGGLDGCLRLLDQTLLPAEVREIDCRTVDDVWEAIRSLRVRGAPAIGVAAAYGVVIGVQQALNADRDAFDRALVQTVDRLAGSRPTAVNLFWALERMQRVASAAPSLSPPAMAERLLAEAGPGFFG